MATEVMTDLVDKLNASMTTDTPPTVYIMPGSSVDVHTDGVKTLTGYAVTCVGTDPVCPLMLYNAPAGTSMYSISLPEGVDSPDAYFKSHLRTLSMAVPQHSRRPWDLNGDDDQLWLPELGGSFVHGTIKITKYNDPIQHITQYFLIVRASLPHAADQFRCRARDLNMTYNDVVADSRWNRLLQANLDNRDRLAVNAASALKCDIKGRLDSKLKRIMGDEHARLAVPTVCNEWNVFEQHTASNTVTYYNHCLNTLKADTGVLISSACDLEKWLHGNPRTKKEVGGGHFSNEHGNAIPVSTGWVPEDMHANVFENQTPGARARIRERFTWEGKMCPLRKYPP